MNVIRGPFDGAASPDDKTPVEWLIGHTAYVERKRQEEDRGKEHMPPNGAPAGMKVTRIDEGSDNDPLRLILITMEGSRPSIILGGTPLESSSSTCITAHNGKEFRLIEDGAVAFHLSSNMGLRLAAEMIESLMPRFTPPVAFAASKFLEAIRTKEDNEKSPIIN